MRVQGEQSEVCPCGDVGVCVPGFLLSHVDLVVLDHSVPLGDRGRSPGQGDALRVESESSNTKRSRRRCCGY